MNPAPLIQRLPSALAINVLLQGIPFLLCLQRTERLDCSQIRQGPRWFLPPTLRQRLCTDALVRT